MTWEDEQEKLMVEARLLASSPELVFDELKKLSAKARAQHWNDDKYEISLISRNERLINLGLAAYGTNQEVFKALYKHGTEPPQDISDASYKEGLRIGCLSNQTIAEAHFFFHFPDDLIGPEETQRVLLEAQGNELTALMQNPKVSDRLLEELYQRTGVYEKIPEERRLTLINVSASNIRLVTREDTYDSPGTGHYGIHKAIFDLLQNAPVNYHWLRAIYHLLEKLDFQQVYHPEQIDKVLARWAKLPTSVKDNSVIEGYWTALSLKDEFRCLIAALFGKGFADKTFIIHGRPDDADVALRCAYYGNGDLTAKEMNAGYQKDKEVFSFAATLNRRTHQRRDLRKLMEEEFLGGDLAERWLRYDEQVRRRWPNAVPPVSESLPAESTTQPSDDVRSSIIELQKGLTTLTSRLAELRNLVILGAIILGVLIYFRSKY